MDATPRSAPGRASATARAPRGFTLLEVLVAVAILGLGLTAILSAQAGAFSSAAHARYISLGTGLARCKMTELEDRIRQQGLPLLDENDMGPCCEGDDSSGMTCSWKIEKPQMPDPKLGTLDLAGSASPSSSGAPGLGALGDLAKNAKSGNPADVAKSLSGLNLSGDPNQGASGLLGDGGVPTAQGATSLLNGLLGTFMQMVYPSLKSLFEASARRVTVKLTWKEGSREHSIELMQWVAVPQLPPQLNAPIYDDTVDDPVTHGPGGRVGAPGSPPMPTGPLK